MYDLVVEAELHRLGYTLTFLPMAGIVGDNDRPTRTIRLSSRLTPIEKRSTIMHECAHVELGHEPTDDEDLDIEMEAEANRWAAAKLIPQWLLDYAESLGRDSREVAEICCVDEVILAARREGIPRTGRLAQASHAHLRATPSSGQKG